MSQSGEEAWIATYYPHPEQKPEKIMGRRATFRRFPSSPCTLAVAPPQIA